LKVGRWSVSTVHFQSALSWDRLCHIFFKLQNTFTLHSLDRFFTVSMNQSLEININVDRIIDLDMPGLLFVLDLSQPLADFANASAIKRST
jgi:hypothetical protein